MVACVATCVRVCIAAIPYVGTVILLPRFSSYCVRSHFCFCGIRSGISMCGPASRTRICVGVVAPRRPTTASFTDVRRRNRRLRLRA